MWSVALCISEVAQEGRRHPGAGAGTVVKVLFSLHLGANHGFSQVYFRVSEPQIQVPSSCYKGIYVPHFGERSGGLENQGRTAEPAPGTRAEDVTPPVHL